MQYRNCPAQLFLGRRGRRRNQAELATGLPAQLEHHRRACWLATCLRGAPVLACLLACLTTMHVFGHCRGRPCSSPLGWDVLASWCRHLFICGDMGSGSLVKLAGWATMCGGHAQDRRRRRGPSCPHACAGQTSGPETGSTVPSLMIGFRICSLFRDNPDSPTYLPWKAMLRRHE